tara:strand:+ start:429 stop:674 length:246 start_codon:yes stop_codon:yes gene_type:complete
MTTQEQNINETAYEREREELPKEYFVAYNNGNCIGINSDKALLQQQIRSDGYKHAFITKVKEKENALRRAPHQAKRGTRRT